MGYRGYGLPVSELISEGNIGLMQGVKKFEADRGFRLATYAMWWIRASIQEYHPAFSWSPGEDGHDGGAEEAVLQPAPDEEPSSTHSRTAISAPRMSPRSRTIWVSPPRKSRAMNRRMAMGGDTSLNVPMREDGDGSVAGLAAVDDAPLQDKIACRCAGGRCSPAASARHRGDGRSERARAAHPHRTPADRRSQDARRIEPGLRRFSRERVRQIEVRAFEKLQKAMMRLAGEQAD